MYISYLTMVLIIAQAIIGLINAVRSIFLQMELDDERKQKQFWQEQFQWLNHKYCIDICKTFMDTDN